MTKVQKDKKGLFIKHTFFLYRPNTQDHGLIEGDEITFGYVVTSKSLKVKDRSGNITYWGRE